ncbi:MAG: 30S ribosomal protein S6 [Mycoplasma sp.]|nr:30S ribosomal protein S6 [Mycoplasma sp.]
MPKYEIMLILDPQGSVEETKKLTVETFGEKSVISFEKMERTDLAYAIKGSMKAIYLLANVETEGSNIAEFKRKLSLRKDVWRELIINLDEEKQLKEKKVFKSKRTFTKKPNARFDRKPNDKKNFERRNSENKKLESNKPQSDK